MNDLRIRTPGDRTAFEPGEAITGAVYWSLASPPRAIELRLFWFTRGKGTEDFAVADTQRFESPLAEEARPFRLQLPEAPYSFSGKLISLVWALELVVEPSGGIERLELVVAPGGREVLLGTVPDEPRRGSFFGQGG